MKLSEYGLSFKLGGLHADTFHGLEKIASHCEDIATPKNYWYLSIMCHGDSLQCKINVSERRKNYIRFEKQIVIAEGRFSNKNIHKIKKWLEIEEIDVEIDSMSNIIWGRKHEDE